MAARAEVDLRAGGRYRITMLGPDGSERRVGGVYREIDPPAKLVYTWKWEESAMPDSTVTVGFIDRDKSTETRAPTRARLERLPGQPGRVCENLIAAAVPEP